ncbi:MAG: putative DNA binding domain-containing protein [Dysgonamonadaceae bacterium]|jgi:predicted HTH transcriptional regulator|nr:putative DNA binding domain-containing protein [Dysgonamonadaceae bacterium]
MNYNIDLKELSIRESEKVEWKENGNDKELVKSIVKTISAFANDLSNMGGGYVVCGAKETKDEFGFQKVIYTGLSSDKLKEIEGKVLAHCRDNVSPSLSPITQEIDNPGDQTTKILIFIVIASHKAHTYRDGETSNYYVRIGKETREARNGILAQLLTSKQEIAPFDKRPNPNVGEVDIDTLLFRDCMNEMKLTQPSKPLEDYFSDKEQIAEFVPPLLMKKSLDDELCLRNFTLFMFGKKNSISLNFSDAYTSLSIYNGMDRSEPTAEKHLLTGSIIEQARKAIELLNTQAYTAFDKTSDKPNQVKYPRRALQEALINAIVHRDYEIPEPTRITVFSDRIEIKSPGSLHWGIDKDKFLAGKASPKWRNQSFAYLFNKLQLAQSEGQGIPTIIRTMKEEGCPDPIFEIGLDSLTCILPAHPRHRIIREVQEIQDKIILGKLDEAKNQVLQLLETDLYNFRTLDLYCEILGKQRNPQELFDFLNKKSIDCDLVNSNTLITIVEILNYERSNVAYQRLADDILSKALSGKIEESQIEKAVVNLKKLGEAENVIKFIDDAISKHPNLSSNSKLLEKRATSKMDLAKKCIGTGRDNKSSAKIKARAWDMCRQYLNEAEENLNDALNYAEDPNEKFFIEENDIKFLEKMKEIAKKTDPDKRFADKQHTPARK